MRQLESAWYDGARIERSKVRIRRLGYFDDVNIETPPVAGTTDQADVEVTVTEKATGNLLAGIGYSSADKLVFNASVSQQNIFGSGNALTAGINTSSVNRTIAVTFVEPYWTVDGVSRTLEVYQRNVDPSNAVGRAVPVVHVGRGGQFRHPDLGDRHRQSRLPLRAHGSDAFRHQSTFLLSGTSTNSATAPTASLSAWLGA